MNRKQVDMYWLVGTVLVMVCITLGAQLWR
jgi:hypothetical protein